MLQSELEAGVFMVRLHTKGGSTEEVLQVRFKLHIWVRVEGEHSLLPVFYSGKSVVSLVRSHMEVKLSETGTGAFANNCSIRFQGSQVVKTCTDSL